MRSPIHYFDANATHPPLADILRKVHEEYFKEFFNPSGATRFSLRNQAKLEDAREFFAMVSGFPSDGLVFSGSGTEANHLMIAALRTKFPECQEVYTSSFEHPSMYAALRNYGFRPIVTQALPSGVIDTESFEKSFQEKPLPTVMIYASNETGVIQPLEEVRRILGDSPYPLFSDAMQALGKTWIDYGILDGFTCSGHKLGAGLGCGLTAVRADYNSKDWRGLGGGNQENGHRAGTENFPAIQCFQQTVAYQLQRLGGVYVQNLTLRKRLETLCNELGCTVVAEHTYRLPNTILVLLPIEDVDFFLMGMEERGICLATGSSCKSRAREASPALLSMGYSKEDALRAIRISFGGYTTTDDVSALEKGLREILTILN